jgi:hypothetical protein
MTKLGALRPISEVGDLLRSGQSIFIHSQVSGSV